MSRTVRFDESAFKEAMTDALEYANDYNVTDYDYDYWVGFRSFLGLVWHNLTHKKKLRGNGLPTKPEHFSYVEIEDELPKWKQRIIRRLLGDKVDKFFLTTRKAEK
jgi:hypothetical protein